MKSRLPLASNKKIKLVLDLDGVTIPDEPNALHYYMKHRQFLPFLFTSYHCKNIIYFMDENITYTYILVPGMLEMLHYLATQLKDKIDIIFFSAGPAKRNTELVERIKEKVAQRMGKNPGDLNWPVYSFENCTEVIEDTELDPILSHDLHIPEAAQLVIFQIRYIKKILSIHFQDIENVILVDNRSNVVVEKERKNLLKVPTCTLFSGADFKDYRGTLMQNADSLRMNFEFFKSESFCRDNLPFYILGVISEVLIIRARFKISASDALELVQRCPKTKKYKYALNKPIYERYEPSYYYQGFCLLKGDEYLINPKLVLYAPYPENAPDALQIFMNEQQKTFIKNALLKETAQYWDARIYHLMAQYYGNEIPQNFYKISQTFFANSQEFHNTINNKTEVPPCIKKASEKERKICAVM